MVPFLFSVNETEAAVFEEIDWIGSNKPSSHITLTYNVYSLLVERLFSRKSNVQQHLPSILHEIDANLVLPNKISNLPRKIKNYLETGGDGNAVVKELCKDPCHDLPYISTKYGITMGQLISKTFTHPDHPMPFTNKDILYLRRLLHYKNLTWTHAEYLVNILVCNSSAYLETPTDKEIRLQWNDIHQKFHSHKTSSSEAINAELDSFLSHDYHIPGKQTLHSKKQNTENLEKEVEAQQEKMKNLRVELVQTYSSNFFLARLQKRKVITKVNVSNRLKRQMKRSQH